MSLPLKLRVETLQNLPVSLQKLGYFLEISTGSKYPFRLGAIVFEEDHVSFEADIPLADGQHFYRLCFKLYKDGKVEIY